MKKKSASQSAFFNLRVLIGLFIVLAGVFLALAGLGTFSAITASSAQAQQKHQIINVQGLPPGFDCSTIHEKGIDKQENLRAGAIMIACGEAQGGSASSQGDAASPFRALSPSMQKLLAPLFIGGPDVDVILPDGTYPKVTQSESMEWGGPNNTWVVNYNDSRTAGACYSGLSYSTDNGVTWHAGQPLCSGHGTNFGDPIVVYNAALNMWFAGDLATGCGGQGIGLWTSPSGVTWTSSNAGPAFQGPGRAVSGYFALAFSTIWRHMGWGQPAANGSVVSLDYAACGQNVSCGSATDHGDVYYIRSTDAGVTWGTPVKLNTDAGTAMQWQPSLTATQAGAIFASWYDEREVNGGAGLNVPVRSPNPCYRRWGRVSLDNGANSQPDDMVGRELSGLPAQPEPTVHATYEGDYDYHSANGTATNWRRT